MTTQVKHFIEVSDITAMRFECPCGNAVITPIAKYKEMPLACSNCGHKFAYYENNVVQQRYQSLLDALKSVEEGATLMGFKFLLEIRQES